MPVASEPQAMRLAAKLPPLPPEEADQPRVLIPGALKLTREQEDRLIQHIRNRREKLKGDLGLKDYSNETWYTQAGNSNDRSQRKHLDTQYMALMTYAMKFDWRPHILGGIFQKSNLHVPLTRRILQQQIARLIAYFTGTEPYYSAYDVGGEDKVLAEKLDKWIRHILDSENNTRADIDAGLERAAVTSAAFYSLSYQRRYSYYQSEKSVWIGPDGTPITGQSDGDYIIEGEDEFVEETEPQMDPATQQPVLDAAGMPMTAATGRMVLKRDGVTPWNPNSSFKKMMIWRRILLQEGPKAELLMPGDFLYPLDAPSLDKADILWHRVSEPLIELVHRYQQMPGLSPEETLKRVALMLERLLPEGNRTPDAEAKHARPDLNEPANSLGSDDQEPQINMGRFCLHFDANEDGNMEDIFVILTEDDYPIVYDYVPNFTPDGRRPYRRLRINPVAGRMHGQGNVELYEALQTDADLVLNRWNFSQSSSGRVTFWRPTLTVEGQANPNLTLNDGGTYTPVNDKKAADILEYVSLPELKGMELQKMLEFLMQIGMNMSGVTNTNDAGVAGLQQTKLATGIREIEKSGMELFGKYIADLTPDVRDLVRSLSLLAIAHLDSPKAFKYFNGDVAVLAEIKPDQVRNISLDISLELTKYRGEQETAQAQSAAAAATQFYALAPIIQSKLAPLFRQQLKAFQIKDVDEIIQPLDPTLIDPRMLIPVGQVAGPSTSANPPTGNPASATLPI